MSLVYGAILVLLIGCMAMLDVRFSLVLRRAPRHIIALILGIGFFVLWDLVAIAMGFYYRGESDGMSGILLTPEFPIEELLFITFLCYMTLVLHAAIGLVIERRRGDA
ncbi:lycopene cyclase domain-containing protein [Flaviflexus huanghaiensis]|uniref:lycopene cyclase domain-containing protein n=1 Tax=Flaviflexus huanghaiensis TaxID=1111473 RepID=UPI0019D6573B|nr:lycopene cyclase domain-containing protein [Flaviflexus huanghaiensis]